MAGARAGTSQESYVNWEAIDDRSAGPPAIFVALAIVAAGAVGGTLHALGGPELLAIALAVSLVVAGLSVYQNLRYGASHNANTLAPAFVHHGHESSSALSHEAVRSGLPAPARDRDGFDILTARISHDMRTPLNAVIGFSELMQHELHGPHGDDRYREYATLIRQSGEQLKQTAEQTLAMTELVAAPTSERSRVAVSVAQIITSVRDEVGLNTHLMDNAAARLIVEVQEDLFVKALAALVRHIADESCVPSVAISVTEVGDCVLISLPDKRRRRQQTGDYPAVDESLPLCFARTVLELQHIPIQHLDGGSGSPNFGRSGSIVLTVPCALQADLPLDQPLVA